MCREVHARCVRFLAKLPFLARSLPKAAAHGIATDARWVEKELSTVVIASCLISPLLKSISHNLVVQPVDASAVHMLYNLADDRAQHCGMASVHASWKQLFVHDIDGSKTKRGVQTPRCIMLPASGLTSCHMCLLWPGSNHAKMYMQNAPPGCILSNISKSSSTDPGVFVICQWRLEYCKRIDN